MSSNLEKRRPRWTGPEKWQVALGTLSLLVAVIALVGSSPSRVPTLETVGVGLDTQRARSFAARPGS